MEIQVILIFEPILIIINLWVKNITFSCKNRWIRRGGNHICSRPFGSRHWKGVHWRSQSRLYFPWRNSLRSRNRSGLVPPHLKFQKIIKIHIMKHDYDGNTRNTDVGTLRHLHFDPGHLLESRSPMPTMVPVNLNKEMGAANQIRSFFFLNKLEVLPYLSYQWPGYMNYSVMVLYLCSGASSPSNLILNRMPIEWLLLRDFIYWSHGTMNSEGLVLSYQVNYKKESKC